MTSQSLEKTTFRGLYLALGLVFTLLMILSLDFIEQEQESTVQLELESRSAEIARSTAEILRLSVENLHASSSILLFMENLSYTQFKSLTERRTGIDFWLRQIEAIRDEHHVSFLVISELTRGKGGGYGEKPDMGSFKESGDIEYSADNALILMPDWDPLDPDATRVRKNQLWMVASRENNPGQVAHYQLEYPYWRFREV